jgi:hypothetical protein
VNAIGDRQSDRDRYTITISRSAASVGSRTQTGLFPAGEWSRRGALLKLGTNGTGTVSYRVSELGYGCTESSTSKQDCYFNAEFKLSGSPSPFLGELTRTWWSEGTTPVADSEFESKVPEVGSEMTFRIDAAADKGYYQDYHGTVDLCGTNSDIPKSGCS